MKDSYLLSEYDGGLEDMDIWKPLFIGDKKQLELYIDNLTKEPESVYKKYTNQVNYHVRVCQNIIRKYLNANLQAIDGWKHVGSLKDEEKQSIIRFCVANFSFHYGKNIIEAKYNNGFINKYCNIKLLSKPYPKLPKHPKKPRNLDNFRFKSHFKIELIKNINEQLS